MTSDVQAATLTSTGAVFAGPARIKAIAFVSTASAGSIVLRDGGESGTVLMTLATQAGVDFNDIRLPGNGLRFPEDCHATLTGVTSVTFFYA
jgi:hypothetical protein